MVTGLRNDRDGSVMLVSRRQLGRPRRCAFYHSTLGADSYFPQESRPPYDSKNSIKQLLSLHQFDKCGVFRYNESHPYAFHGAERLQEYILTLNRFVQVVNLEGYMC